MTSVAVFLMGILLVPPSSSSEESVSELDSILCLNTKDEVVLSPLLGPSAQEPSCCEGLSPYEHYGCFYYGDLDGFPPPEYRERRRNQEFDLRTTVQFLPLVLLLLLILGLALLIRVLWGTVKVSGIFRNRLPGSQTGHSGIRDWR